MPEQGRRCPPPRQRLMQSREPVALASQVSGRSEAPRFAVPRYRSRRSVKHVDTLKADMDSSSAGAVSASPPMPESGLGPDPPPVHHAHDPTQAPVSEEVIRTRSLRKVYPKGIVAVDDLDLSVRRGEIFGLLGPNGAGKSTTVGMLTTRVIPTSGGAQVGGIDVVAEPARAKQVIGVVSQANTLDQGLNVWENLYFHGRFFGLANRARRAIV